MNLKQVAALHKLMGRAQIPGGMMNLDDTIEICVEISYQGTAGFRDIWELRLWTPTTTLVRYDTFYMDDGGNLYLWDADAAEGEDLVPCVGTWRFHTPRLWQHRFLAVAEVEISAGRDATKLHVPEASE